MSDNPKVSFVIPTYNEEEDIRRSLEACINQDYDNTEIIVVDDSTDDTPDIIREYNDLGVKLIRPSRKGGRCRARNIGIKEAKGEIVVILNADVFPEPDFTTRILTHYQNGVDYVLVKQEVANQECLLPRFVAALDHEYFDSGNHDYEWTEGFSCRRDAAIKVGLFPETPIPMCAGEDAYFGRRLAGEDGYFGKKVNKGHKKVIDKSIVVRHVTEEKISDFWKKRMERGRGTPQRHYFLGRMPFPKLLLRTIAKTGWITGEIMLFFPILLHTIRLVKYSPKGFRDLLPFLLANVLDLAGKTTGEWHGLMQILAALIKGELK